MIFWVFSIKTEPTEPLVGPQKPNLEPTEPQKTERTSEPNQVGPNTSWYGYAMKLYLNFAKGMPKWLQHFKFFITVTSKGQ